MRLAQSPRELSSPVPHMRCAEFGQLWLNPIMSSHLTCDNRQGGRARGSRGRSPAWPACSTASWAIVPSAPARRLRLPPLGVNVDVLGGARVSLRGERMRSLAPDARTLRRAHRLTPVCAPVVTSCRWRPSRSPAPSASPAVQGVLPPTMAAGQQAGPRLGTELAKASCTGKARSTLWQSVWWP